MPRIAGDFRVENVFVAITAQVEVLRQFFNTDGALDRSTQERQIDNRAVQIYAELPIIEIGIVIAEGLNKVQGLLRVAGIGQRVAERVEVGHVSRLRIRRMRGRRPARRRPRYGIANRGVEGVRVHQIAHE